MYTISSNIVHVVTDVLSYVWDSTEPELYMLVRRMSVRIGTEVSFAAIVILVVVMEVF